MLYAHDTQEALVTAAALVNTGVETEDLPDVPALLAWLDEHRMSGVRRGTRTELVEVQELRDRLHDVWRAGSADAAVPLVNAILADAEARPYLTRHDEFDWHLHVTASDQPLAHRLGAEAAMGFVDLLRAGDFARLKTCAAADCEAVLVDLSKNSSKRFCDTGNCANRTHVAAYRARKRTAG